MASNGARHARVRTTTTPYLLPQQEIYTEPVQPSRSRAAGLRRRLGAALAAVQPLADHVRDNAYAFLTAGCVDAAGFVHSDFTGLLVTALGFVFVEWRSR